MCSILTLVAYGSPPQMAGSGDTMGFAVVIVFIIVLTTAFQTFQEGKSDKAMTALKELTPENAHVVRDGKPNTMIPAD